MANLFIAGVEPGDSKPGVQKWIPVKREFRSVKNSIQHRNSDVQLAQRCLVDQIKRNVIKVYDGDTRMTLADMGGSNDLLIKLKGKTLKTVSGRVLTGSDLSEIIKRYIKDYRGAWGRVDGSSTQLSQVDRMGHKGSDDEKREHLDRLEHEARPLDYFIPANQRDA